MNRFSRRALRAAATVTTLVALSLTVPSPVDTTPSEAEAAGLAAVSLVTAAAAGRTAAASTGVPITPRLASTSTLVGDGELRFIESVYAPGKIVELGNANGQQTGPSGATYTAPAAVFTISSVATVAHAQAVVFSPVTGLTDTYVISAQDGRVLSRRDNTSSDFRYLQLTERAIDDAAVDPYAQWTAVDAGNGEVYLHNVQREPGGGTAALDLYNWKTADASEVQTYSAGTSAVQKWELHSLTPTVSVDTSIVQPGTTPRLPTLLRAVYSWGPRFEMSDLAWDLPDTSVWNTDGTVTVTGTGMGYFGEEVPIEAKYLVGSFTEDAEATYDTFAGVLVKELRMRAPRTVARSISGSDQTVTSPVTWDWSGVNDADFAGPGIVTVPAAARSGFTAKLVITVTESAITNILRDEGVHYAYTYMDGSSFRLADGVRDVVGFSDWRSGGATNRVNPNAVTFFLDDPRQVTGAAVFDIAGTKNVGGVTVQYRTLTGGWVDLPGTDWPYTNTASDLSLEVTNAPVVATGVRVIFTSKSTSTWMTLSEIEISGLESGSVR